MSWEAYRLVPADVLFFRDGKPSSRGEDHYLRSMFPPNPSVLYGAIRTARLMEEETELTRLDDKAWGTLSQSLLDEIGPWGGFGTLALRGPWLVRDGETLLPAPADLGLIAERNSPETIRQVIRYLPVSDVPAQRWSHDYRLSLPHVLVHNEWHAWEGEAVPASTAGWFLTPDGMRAWLHGSLPDAGTFVHSSKLWSTELRTGVGLDDTARTAKKGLLYTFGFVRLQRGVSIGFELEGGTLKIGSSVRLGAEGRTAEIFSGDPFPFASSAVTAGRRGTAVFVTPALSENGASPPRVMKATTDTAFVRGAHLVGGWDMAKHRPKPLRRAIPAGSVYLVEHDDVTSLHGRNISDALDTDWSRQGFGLTLVGRRAGAQ